MKHATRHPLLAVARTALAVTVVTTLALPAGAGAAEDPETSGASLPAAVAAPKDAYENDATPATARDLLAPDVWAGMSRFATTPLTQARTLHAADDARPDEADQDWLRFEVDDTAVSSGMSLLIEAVTSNPRVDPVIELYGPYPDGKLPSPTPVSALVAGDDGATQTDPVALAGFDDDPWFAGRGASAALVLDPGGDGAGTYFVRIRPYWAGASGGFGGGAGAYTLRVKAGLATRLAGKDRYSTAVAVSRERYGAGALAGGACVVASGEGFADALAGSTLAGAVRGPLLLTARRSLPSVVGAEVRRLGVSTVYVLGGTVAVGGKVAASLDKLPGVNVVRVAGRDRYETAVRVAERAAAVLRERGESLAPVAFVASGATFPDALAAAPMAAYNTAPVLLTPRANAQPGMMAALARLGVTDVVVVGGTPAVSAGVQRALARRLGSSHVRRLAGSDRFSTARAVAAWAVAGGADGRVGTSGSPASLRALQPASVGLASGVSFADALTGGVLCGQRGAPVLLTSPGKLSSGALGYGDSLGRTFLKSYAFGGSPAISQTALDHFDLLTTSWWGSQ